MSTAIMHQSALYDFGEILLKNQSAARNSMNHLNNNSNSTQQMASGPGSNAMNNNSYGGSPMTPTSPTSPLQQQIANQKLLRWSQDQHTQLAIHQALSRANSTPQGPALTAGHVTSLVNSLIEGLGSHRKLERAQSEPLPQALRAQAQAALAAQINTSRYKTELCRPFEEAGVCKYGDKCQFAHGMHELRNLQRHPKYKTELCRTFHSVGFCPYGPRCHFLHNAEDALPQQPPHRSGSGSSGYSRPAPLSLSPTFSMSTGSDRTSPAGSLSQSPTSSLASFFSSEQDLHSPMGGAMSAYPQQHPHSAHPTAHVGTGPAFAFPQDYAPPSPATPPVQQSPRDSPQPLDDARLPVFNRFTATLAAFNDLVI